MLSLDWAEGSGEAQSPYKRAGKLRNTTVAVLETVSQRQSRGLGEVLGWPKICSGLPDHLTENPKKLFGQPNTWKKSTLQGPGVLP